MITAEVQRTLVKSPPELWTELSDPASLARHLGEFGEITITRLEPERTVAWEGENAAGEILIKPSGWGTRVTLRVTREQEAESSAADGACGEQETGAAHGEAPAHALDAELDLYALPAQAPEIGAPEPAGAGETPEPPEAPIAAAEDVAPAPVADAGAPDQGLADAVEPTPDFWPVPAASTWAAQLHEPALEAGEPAPEQEPLSDAWAVPQAHEAPQERPREGFFARLFRRRARRRAGELELYPPSESSLDAAGHAGEADDRTAAAEDPHTGESGAAGEQHGEHAAATPQEHDCESPEQWAAGPAELPEAAPAAVDPQGRAETEPRPPAAPSPEPLPPAAVAEPLAEVSRAETESGDAAESQEATRAVLSSMLDRLGTAHHRPFSRG